MEGNPIELAELERVNLEDEQLQDFLFRHCSRQIPAGKVHRIFLLNRPKIVVGAILVEGNWVAYLCRDLKEVDHLTAFPGKKWAVRWYAISKKRFDRAMEVLLVS